MCLVNSLVIVTLCKTKEYRFILLRSAMDNTLVLGALTHSWIATRIILVHCARIIVSSPASPCIHRAGIRCDLLCTGIFGEKIKPAQFSFPEYTDEKLSVSLLVGTVYLRVTTEYIQECHLDINGAPSCYTEMTRCLP